MSRRAALVVVVGIILLAALVQQKYWKQFEEGIATASSPPPIQQQQQQLRAPGAPLTTSTSIPLVRLRELSPKLQRFLELGKRRDVLSLLMAHRASTFTAVGQQKPAAAPSGTTVAAVAAAGAASLGAHDDGGEMLCTLLLLGYDECEHIFASSSPLLDTDACIRHVGFAKFDQTLHPACAQSPWWDNVSTAFGSPSSGFALWLQQQKSGNKKNKKSGTDWFAQPASRDKYRDAGGAILASFRVPLPQDFVRKAQLLIGGDADSTMIVQRAYVPPSRRTYAQITAFVDVIEGAPPPPPAVVGAAGAGRRAAQQPIIVAPAGSPADRELQKRMTVPIRIHGLGFAIPSRLVRRSVPPLHQKLFSLNPALPVWCCNTRHDHELPARPDDAVTQVRYRSTFDQEFTFSQVLRHSFFAFSNRRGNFDCQRHTEILASGAVIYMPDLAIRRGECAVDTCMPGYPKQMMMEALELPGIRHWPARSPQQALLNAGGGRGSGDDDAPFAHSNEYFLKDHKYINVMRRPEIDFATFDERRYLDLANRMLNFTRHHLTCAAMVAYMLRVMKHEEPRSALLLVPEFEDYQSMAVECGFGELGLNYTTNRFSPPGIGAAWPLWQRRVPQSDESARFNSDDWLTEERVRKKPNLYGAGFVWAMRTDPPPNPRIASDRELEQRIRAGEFDLVVAANLAFRRNGRWKGSVFQHMPALVAAAETLPSHRIAFVETADYPVGVAKWDQRLKDMIRNGSFCFSRELHEYDPRVVRRTRRN